MRVWQVALALGIEMGGCPIEEKSKDITAPFERACNRKAGLIARADANQLKFKKNTKNEYPIQDS